MTDNTAPTRETITGAVARGWGWKRNAHKEMDPDLATAIVDEVMLALVSTPSTLSQSRSAAIKLREGVATAWQGNGQAHLGKILASLDEFDRTFPKDGGENG